MKHFSKALISIILGFSLASCGGIKFSQGFAPSSWMSLKFMLEIISGSNAIKAFSINGVSGTILGTAISVKLPCTVTDVTALVAEFATGGGSVTVGGVPQESGVTPNDFTGSIIYAVTSKSGDVRNYTVTVTVAPADAKEITAFSINGVAGVIVGTGITVTLPCTVTDVTALIATFTTTGESVTIGTTDQVSGTTPNNFTGSVTYRVHACDTTTTDYTVTVAVQTGDAKEMTAFSLAGRTGTIGATTIDVTVPYGTSVTSMAATFTATGNSVTVGGTAQTSGVTAHDFSSPVIYRVNACDLTYTDYTVTVTEEPPTPYTQEKIQYDNTAAQVAETVTVFISEIDFAATYAQNNFNGLVLTIMPNFFYDSIVLPSCTTSLKSSTNAGTDGIWMNDDDTGTYAVNTFDTGGAITRTDLYADLTGTSLVGYSEYTLNAGGTYQKVLTYDASSTLQNSLYFTFSGGLVTQIDQWSGDGTGTHLKIFSIVYDSSNRGTSMTCEDLVTPVSSLKLTFGFTGSNIAASSQEFYGWDGSSWTLASAATNTLNGAGTRTVHVSISPPFGGMGAADYTFNASGYDEHIDVYSDTAGTTSLGYYEYTYY